AGLLVLGKAGGAGGGRDRVIKAVAGAHADGAEGAARHRHPWRVAAAAWREHRPWTEQGIEQPAAWRRRCCDLLLILRGEAVRRGRRHCRRDRTPGAGFQAGSSKDFAGVAAATAVAAGHAQAAAPRIRRRRARARDTKSVSLQSPIAAPEVPTLRPKWCP